MIHYFTYYSVGGGYKDLYLGNSSQTDACRFFLPLLKIEQKQARFSATSSISPKNEDAIENGTRLNL